MAAKTKPASVTYESDMIRCDRIREVFAPFGWNVKGTARCTSDAEAADVDAWLEDCETDRMGTITTPDPIWRFVEMPVRVLLNGFRSMNDAIALAAALMPDSAKYFEWICDPTEDSVTGSLADLPSETSTPFGTVFAELKGDVSSIWFGRKANQQPAFSGSAAVDAVKCLFNVAAESSDHAPRDQRDVSPVAEPTPVSKSKRIAKPKAARADSPNDAEPRSSRRSETATFHAAELRYIPLSQIQPAKENHRKTFDKAALTELAESIKAHGVLQPLLLRRAEGVNPPVHFQIIAGERRYRAALQAGLTEVPVQIVERDGVSESLAMLHENIIRVDLNPIERAQAIRRLMDEHGLSQKEVGQMVGCQQGQISNELRLLNLPEPLQQLVAAGEIAPTLIRVVLPVAEYSAVTEEIVRSIDLAKKNGLPVEQTMLQRAMCDAVKKHSRSMTYESDWQSWANPDPKKRHFSKTTPDQENQLNAQELKFLHTWEGQRRTFNVTLFDELNKGPLASRREKHRKYKAERGFSEKPKVSKDAKPFEQEYRVRRCIEASLVPLLADALEQSRDKQKARAVCLTMLAAGDNLGEALTGKLFREVVPDLLKAFDVPPAELDRFLRDNLVAELRRDYSLDAKESIALANALGVDLLQAWQPTTDLLEVLTDHGRDLVTAAAGSIPEFLLPFFGIEPAKRSKKTKGTAA